MPKISKLNYKRLGTQQLRCLCETARLGSLTAAAAALEVSNPTVWKEVHALEREFGVKLVEPHRRGCHLTAPGRLLVEMAGPTVESMQTLRERFRAAMSEAGVYLPVAVTPRFLQLDIAHCLMKYHERFPRVRFGFMELPDYEVAAAVEERRADFGFTSTRLTEEQQRALAAEPCYALEVRLVTPKDHPLARRRTVHPRDLRPYSLINAPTEYFHTFVDPVLRRYNAYPTKERVVQASFAASIRELVDRGFGIGLVTTVPLAPPDPRLHERSMNRFFGSVPVNLIRRRGAFTPEAGEEFISFVRRELTTTAP